MKSMILWLMCPQSSSELERRSLTRGSVSNLTKNLTRVFAMLPCWCSMPTLWERGDGTSSR